MNLLFKKKKKHTDSHSSVVWAADNPKILYFLVFITSAVRVCVFFLGLVTLSPHSPAAPVFLMVLVSLHSGNTVCAKQYTVGKHDSIHLEKELHTHPVKELFFSSLLMFLCLVLSLKCKSSTCFQVPGYRFKISSSFFLYIYIFVLSYSIVFIFLMVYSVYYLFFFFP